MQLKVYDGEYIQRGKAWYLSFWLINLTLIVLWFFYENLRGAILQIALVWGYFYTQMKSSLVVDLEIQEQGLQIGERFFAYSQLRGFLVEADAKTRKPTNLLIFTQKDHHTYTFADTSEQIQLCLDVLLERLPYIEDYQPSLMDKLIKKIKI